MLDDLGGMFLALGPVVILVVGTLATIVIAVSVPTPSATLWVLALGPAVSFSVACGGVFLVEKLIHPADGSGFLLGGAALRPRQVGRGPQGLELALEPPPNEEREGGVSVGGTLVSRSRCLRQSGTLLPRAFLALSGRDYSLT